MLRIGLDKDTDGERLGAGASFQTLSGARAVMYGQ
jgi:hypothetical protein